jgi:predicted RNase H-like nuclease (RuvC/YqgF family)
LILALLCLAAAAVPLLNAQSLAEAARREAERRREIDRQGLEAKVIEGDPAQLAPDGNLSTSSPVRRDRPTTDREVEPRRKGTPRSYRTKIQKLDREIRSGEDRIAALRERLRRERWALPKVGRISRSSGGSGSQERLQAQIGDLESKVRQLRKERRETYDEGRRAGFLPGELDGRGQMP